MTGQCDACGRENRELRKTIAYGIETIVCAEGCEVAEENKSAKGEMTDDARARLQP